MFVIDTANINRMIVLGNLIDELTLKAYNFALRHSYDSQLPTKHQQQMALIQLKSQLTRFFIFFSIIKAYKPFLLANAKYFIPAS